MAQHAWKPRQRPSLASVSMGATDGPAATVGVAQPTHSLPLFEKKRDKKTSQKNSNE